MAEEKILQDILSVMEREAASQRSRPVKLGNAAVGQQIEQLANAGKVAGILLSIKDDFLAIPEAVTEIPEAVEESTEVREEQVNVFESLKDNINSIGTGLGKFTKAVTVDLADNLKKIGESIKEGAKKTGKFVLTVLAIAGTIALAVKFFEGFFKTDGTLADKIKGGFMSILDLLPEPIKNEIIDVFSQIKKELTPYVEEIKQILAPIWEEVKLWFNTTFLPEIEKALDYITARISEAADRMVTEIMDSLKELPVIGDIIKKRETEIVNQKEFIDEQLLRENPGAFTDTEGNEIPFDDPRREQMREAFLSRVDAPVSRFREENPSLGALSTLFGAVKTSEMARTGIGRGLVRGQNALEDALTGLGDTMERNNKLRADKVGSQLDFNTMTFATPPEVQTPTNTSGAEIELISEQNEQMRSAPSAVAGDVYGGRTTINNSSNQTNIINNENSHTERILKYGF